MNQQSGHLSDQQIRECAGTIPGSSPEDVEAHLSHCESCLGRLLEWQRTQLRIGEPDAMRAKPNADCPEESTLQEVAAEMASPEISARILQHASQCDHCGPLLKQYLEDFSEELSPEIEALIDQLPFSQPQWQREKAKEIVASWVPKWKRVWNQTAEWWSASKIRVTAGAMASLLVAIGITRGPVIWNWWQLWQANGSISAAFVQKRTIPGRFTGVDQAPYQPDHKTLGSAGAADDLTWIPMIEAENELAHKLNSSGKVDSRWYQLRGRISLLKHPDDPKTARLYFQKAQEMGLKDLSLDIDLAVTSFQEESLLGKPDFRKTIDELNKVRSSRHPEPSPEEKKTALYNLAVTYEQMKDWGSAISAWEEYLKADPAGAWADDARRHLEDDRKNAPSHSAYLNPSDYNRNSSDPAVHREIEQYIKIVLERWLVRALEDPTSEAGKAVQDIAETLGQRDHLDPMLMDLLSFAENRRHPVQAVTAVFTGTRGTVNGGWTASKQDRLSAMQALSAAFVYNKNDKPNDAVESSKKAANLFHNFGNLAGELLARYQEIYARQRQLDGETCLNLVNALWDRAFATQYHWLQGELALEKAMCANRVLKSGPTQDGLASSLAQAEKFHFPELKLRVIGADAGIKRLNHHYKEAWWKALEGLNQYWQDRDSSPERYYQFYAVMREIALDTDFPHASETYLRRSIEIFKTAAPEDTNLQAVLYTSLANLLWQMGDDAGAEKEAEHARELIGSKTTVPVHFEMPAIELADFELRRHQPQQALSTLAQIGDAPQTPDDFVRLDFYRVRGDAKLQLRQFDQADADYQNGINVAQKFFEDFAKVKAKRLKDDATRLRDETKRLNWGLAISKIYARMVQVRLEKNQSEKALAMWEWSRSLFLNGNANHLLNAEDAGAIPLPQTAYPHIIYASFEDRMQIWLVQNGRVLAKSVSVTKAELLGRIRAFNMKCGDKESDESEAEKQGEDLYALLLRPIIADLAPPHAGALEDTVAVEWDDALPTFAIEALKDPAGHYFGEDYAVLQSPGTLAEGFLHKPIPLKPGDQFLVADASPENGPEKLPGHELPAQAIKQTYSLTLLKNADLTPLKVRQALQSDDALLVISHGLLGSEGMGLKMTPDWSLRAKDFTPEYVGRLRLAVLAACSSGYSENGLPDPDNMVRSLLASGVPNVIASRWDVDSQSTGELFESFYTYLGQGEPPAQALHDARLKLRSEHIHPYYWAGFYLTGKAN